MRSLRELVSMNGAICAQNHSQHRSQRTLLHVHAEHVQSTHSIPLTNCTHQAQQHRQTYEIAGCYTTPERRTAAATKRAPSCACGGFHSRRITPDQQLRPLHSAVAYCKLAATSAHSQRIMRRCLTNPATVHPPELSGCVLLVRPPKMYSTN